MPTWEFYIIVFLGALAHALKRIIGLKDARNSFSFKIWWQKNGVQTIFGLIISIIIITVLPLSEITKLTAFTVGYSFDSALKAKVLKNPKDDDNK